ncbi:MAG: 50S ribosomal protein L13 [Gammaproteobacteria bacterium]|nr:50S ribosomal protein L13 [Gammaproteobacteria bacterium]
MKTYSANEQTAEQRWYIVDAENKTLGRMATQVARYLRGKHKPEYTPHVDVGDYIVVINAEKAYFSGKKRDDKMYHHYSGYPGGMKSRNLQMVLDSHPERVIESAVRGMMPKGPLGRKMLKKLKVYAGSAHPHDAQQPQPLQIEE